METSQTAYTDPARDPRHGISHAVEEGPVSIPNASLNALQPRINPSIIRHLQWYQDAILYASPNTPSSNRISPIFSFLDHQSPLQPALIVDHRRPVEYRISHGLPDPSRISSAPRPFSYHRLANYHRSTDHSVSHGLPNPSWTNSATLPSSRQDYQNPCPHGDSIKPEASNFHETHPESPEVSDSETSGTSGESVIPHTHHIPAWALPNMSTRLPVGGGSKVPNLRDKPLSPSHSTFPNRITKRAKERRLMAPTPVQQAWLDRQVSMQFARASQQNPSGGHDDSPTWKPESPTWTPDSPTWEPAPESPTWAPESPKWGPESQTWAPESPKW